MIHGIIALDDNGAIGFEGRIPWPAIRANMERFKSLTMGHAVVMGRKTWDSLPAKVRPLPGRTNVVCSRTMPYELGDGRMVFGDVGPAIEWASEGQDVFVIGGAEVYATAANEIEVWHITRIAGIHEADTFFVPDLRGFGLWSHETLAPGVRYEKWCRRWQP